MRPSRNLIVAMVLIITSCSDVEYRSYESFAQLKETGDMNRGWLPSWVPEESLNIHNKYDLDTSSVSLFFEAPEDVKLTNIVLCEEVDVVTKPRLRLSQFPTAIEKFDGVKLCDEFFIYREGGRLYAWKN